MKLYVFFADTRIVLSKRHYGPEADPLHAMPCNTYLGPISPEDAADFLHHCYPDLMPSAHAQVAAFADGAPESTTLTLTLRLRRRRVSPA
jgi:hypothetical protein